MNVINVTDRLPSTDGPYQVITKPLGGYHKAVPNGVTYSGGQWYGAQDVVVAWVDPNEQVVPVVPTPVVAPAEDHTYALVLKSGGANKIGVIKLVREIMGLGLGESKAFVEGAPTNRAVIKAGLTPEQLTPLKEKLTAAGASFEAEVED